MSTVGAGWVWVRFSQGLLVTVIDKVIVAGFFGNWGRGLWNLDVL